MRCKSERGFSLIELIIVVVILGLVATPIVQGIMGSAKLNAESKLLSDANMLLQKYCEIIQAEGPDCTDNSAAKIFRVPDCYTTVYTGHYTNFDAFLSDNPVTANPTNPVGYYVEKEDVLNLDNYNESSKPYVVKCYRYTGSGAITGTYNSGGYAIDGFSNYYKIDLTADKKLTLQKYKMTGNASTGGLKSDLDASYSNHIVNLASNNYSLVFYSGSTPASDNKIQIFDNRQDYSKAPAPPEGEDLFKITDTSSTPIIDYDYYSYTATTTTGTTEQKRVDISKNVWLCDTFPLSTGEKVHVNLYNSAKTNTNYLNSSVNNTNEVNVFYDSEHVDPYIMYDDNIVLHDIRYLADPNSGVNLYTKLQNNCTYLVNVARRESASTDSRVIASRFVTIRK